MRTSSSPSRLTTGPMRSSVASPSASSTTVGGTARGSPLVAVGKSGWRSVVSGAFSFIDITLLGSSQLLGDELGVILHPTEERRAPGVLPGQPQEEQTGMVGDSAAMDDAAVLIEDRNADP